MKELAANRAEQGYTRHTERCCRFCLFKVKNKGGDICFIGGFPVAELGYCTKWEKMEGKVKVIKKGGKR